MSLYEGIKDAITLAQRADNIELYKQLLDLSAQALELQDEIRRLKEENTELKKDNDLESRIVRHPNQPVGATNMEHPYVTLSDDENNIKYCAICWGRDKKLIQLYDELNCAECSRLRK